MRGGDRMLATVEPPSTLDLAFPPGGVLVVTGGGSGIGAAVAHTAAACGVRVAVWDIDGVGAQRVVDEIAASGGEGLAITADATDPAAVDGAMATTIARWGVAPTYLVCNGGPAAATVLATPDGVARVIAGVSVPTEAFLAAGPPPGAAVVNVASIAGNWVAGGSEWYAAGKAAIAGLTRVLAARHGPGVRVNAIAPGVTRTPRTAATLAAGMEADLERRCPLRRPGEAHEAAAVIVFLCSPLASYVTGALVPVDGGIVLHQ